MLIGLGSTLYDSNIITSWARAAQVAGSEARTAPSLPLFICIHVRMLWRAANSLRTRLRQFLEEAA